MAAYADGVSTPSGADRPNARAISNALAQSPEGGITNDRDFTAFVYAWGQFLDHDLSLAEAAPPRERFSVAVPTGDPSFDPTGTGLMTIPMSRSAYDPATGTAAGNPRQQVNSITAFIDGSQVYGSDATRAAAVREHNRIAAAAAVTNPSWSDEQLYQHARRIVIAELQKITHDEFLPALLGSNTPANAARQAQEVGLAGTTVTLVTAAGATIATTTTDARGNYVFKGLDLGSYKVVVTPPSGGAAVFAALGTGSAKPGSR